MWVSGPRVSCSACESTRLQLVRETLDRDDLVYVGTVECLDCGASLLDSRRPNQPRPDYRKGSAMAKRGRNEPSRPKRKTVIHRLNTVKSNGAQPESQEVAPAELPIGEAMRQAVAALGDVVIDESLAASHLRELAESYEQVTREQAAYDQKSEAAKIAKKSLESATELLLEKVRLFTHPKAMPLFDQQQAEADLQAMTGAAAEA